MSLTGLSNAVQGSIHRPQSITWYKKDTQAPLDLTGATITGKIRTLDTQTTKLITGTLNLLSPTDGTFSWDYSVADVETVGEFEVQFTATYPSTEPEISSLTPWIVEEAI